MFAALSNNRRRWSGNDRHFGPFTYASDRRYRALAVVLASGGDEDEEGGCNLRLSAFGHTVIVEMPPIIRPHRQKIQALWDEATVERLGRDWYWQIDSRIFGFSVHEGFLQVFRGRRTHDSATDQTWSTFLPWTQWRHIRHSLFDLDGEHFWTEFEHPGVKWEARQAVEAACPAAKFEFDDFDGARIIATTRIEEREWKFGEGWFKWLSLFRRPKIRRSLDIDFSAGTGRRKGSWKGGTVGSGIDMEPGELHEAAFRRYCAKNDMTFVGAKPA